MKKVNKHTRAGKRGKRIFYPECNKPPKVYHFSWSALTCGTCEQMINKNEWNLGERQFRSNQGSNPKKEIQIYKLIELAFIIGIISLILYLISLQ